MMAINLLLNANGTDCLYEGLQEKPIFQISLLHNYLKSVAGIEM
jgi:hypothetical protein